MDITRQLYKVAPAPVDGSSAKQHSFTLKSHNRPLVKKKIVAVEDSAIATITSGHELPDTLRHTITHQDTAALVVSMPVKKKLRVVHINELRRPLQEEVRCLSDKVRESTSSIIFIK